MENETNKLISIEVSKDAAKVINWVLLARSLDDSRPTLQLLKVAENYIMCTDGFRVHIWKMYKTDAPATIDLQPGLYEIFKPVGKELVFTVKSHTLDTYEKYPEINVFANPKSQFGMVENPTTIYGGMKIGVTPKYYSDAMKLIDSRFVFNFQPPVIWIESEIWHGKILAYIMTFNVRTDDKFCAFEQVDLFDLNEWVNRKENWREI